MLETKTINSKKAAYKAFKNAFPPTEQGYLRRIHGYLYLKYIRLYIYYTSVAVNMLRPVPLKLVKPEGVGYDEVDDVVQYSTDIINATTMNRKTNGYHAKVMIPDDAKKLFSLKEDLNLPDLPKTIVPYDVARRTIIRNPDRILLVDCPCRSARGEEACQPMNVCMSLGEPWVSFMLENNEDLERMHARLITQEEALEILRQQHEQGNIHAAFYKDGCGDQLYGFCNCCTCCCVALTAQNYAKAPLYASSGYKRKVDKSKCKNCGTCASYCHFFSPKMVDGAMVEQPEKCMGCSVCKDKCPNGAISLVRDDPSVSEPLDLDVLIPLYTPEGGITV